MNLFGDITEFHQKFSLKYQGAPRALPKDLQKFRNLFLNEELKEYFHSVTEEDLEGQLDALVDLVYVAIGTAYLNGFDFNEAWYRVHKANMSKIRAERPADSKRGSGFDVVKPEGWQPPSLADLVAIPEPLMLSNEMIDSCFNIHQLRHLFIDAARKSKWHMYQMENMLQKLRYDLDTSEAKDLLKEFTYKV